MVRNDACISLTTIDKFSQDFNTVTVAYIEDKIGSTKWNNGFSRDKSSSLAEKDQPLKKEIPDKSNSFLTTLIWNLMQQA